MRVELKKKKEPDNLQFLFWHLDEYNRTVATLLSRFCETHTYGCVEIRKVTLSTLTL